MSELDRTILRIATVRARRIMKSGSLPDQAVISATPGAWAQYREEVLHELLRAPDAEPPPDPGATPPPARPR